MKLSRIAAITIIPAVALALGGCSGNSPGKSSSPSPTIEKSVAASPTPEVTEVASPGPVATETQSQGVTIAIVEAEPSGIETSVTQALEKQVGVRPIVDCGKEKVKVKAGGTLLCSATAKGDTAVYDLTVTFTQVNADGTFNFDYKVADKPRS